ncbi:MAG: hypothetical protein OEU36_25965, partial [Gammaproteobacteria bacterium]|nr:hypothetical protein [Gammaproteobacteria bacterium]
MARTIALIFFAALVVGCGVLSTAPLSEEEDESAVSNLPPRNPNIAIDEPITLEVWLDLDFTRDNTLFEEMATDFEKVYPEVEVEIFSFVRESMPQR